MFLDSGNVSVHDDRWYTKPWGVNGGGVGARSKKTLVRYSVNRDNPPREIIQSKRDFLEVFCPLFRWMLDIKSPRFRRVTYLSG